MEFNYQDFRKFAKSKGVTESSLNKYKKPQSNITPYIVETEDLNIALVDVFSRLMKDRIIFLGTEIDDYVSNIVSAQMMYLESLNDEEDIKIYINSPGGSVYDGNAILDFMDIVKPEVSTVCTGLAASMASVILSNGQKGKRYALKRSRVMLHQPMGGFAGQSSDVEIAAAEMRFVKNDLIKTLSDNTGKEIDIIEKDIDRDFWLSPTDAVEYGLIDKVLK